MDIDGPGMCDKKSSLPHMLPDPAEFARAAHKELGLKDDMPAVFYSNKSSPFCAAARAWWMLRAFGREDVYVLDGGLSAWRDDGRDVEQGESTTASDTSEDAKSPSLSLQGNRVCTLEQMMAQIKDESGVIIDARPGPRYEGKTEEPRSDLQSGHMPGAINVPSSDVIAEDGKLKSPEQLEALFRKHGVVVDKIPLGAVSVTCGSGVTAATVALALNELGISAAVYDGSWSEYGANKDHPVVTGSLPSPAGQ